jgi:hypothetical protein
VGGKKEDEGGGGGAVGKGHQKQQKVLLKKEEEEVIKFEFEAAEMAKGKKDKAKKRKADWTLKEFPLASLSAVAAFPTNGPPALTFLQFAPAGFCRESGQKRNGGNGKRGKMGDRAPPPNDNADC